MEQKKEITVPQDTTPVKEAGTPFELIANAVQSGKIDIETIKELRALQKEMKEDAAQEAFVHAMADFQKVCPVIKKTKPVKNKQGVLVYNYAPLDSIVAQTKEYIANSNLAYTFKVTNTEKELTATCIVKHIDGHSEETSFVVPIGSESFMTDVQKFGARATFAKRNAFLNAFGISTGDEDTDATQTDQEKMPVDIKSQIVLLLKSLDKHSQDKEVLCKNVLKLTQLELIPENFDEIKSRLEVLVDERNEDKSTEA